jgi:hypothetical protein
MVAISLWSDITPGSLFSEGIRRNEEIIVQEYFDNKN